MEKYRERVSPYEANPAPRETENVLCGAYSPRGGIFARFRARGQTLARENTADRSRLVERG